MVQTSGRAYRQLLTSVRILGPYKAIFRIKKANVAMKFFIDDKPLKIGCAEF